ncbi:MAG TPA: zf-HC2 domain-containing protein [Terriglobia bacterium]|nr:zf-HC2 domain-containing protein [Terriglobia bacterium]
MKCHDRGKLFLFVHRMLAPDEADVMRQHVADCANCARVVDEHRKLEVALGDWNVAEPSPWFDAKVRARVAASEQKNAGFFGFGRVRVLAAGMAAIALILVAVVLFNHQKVAEINQPPGSQEQTTVTAVQPQVPATTAAIRQPLPPEEQLKMDENLSVLEDYEVVANFDALSELPQANDN